MKKLSKEGLAANWDEVKFLPLAVSVWRVF